MEGVTVETKTLGSIYSKQAGFGETRIQNFKYFFKIHETLPLRKCLV